MLGKQYFPKSLELADMTPIYKKKDLTVVENYRPFSALPCVSNVFERTILKYLSSFIDEFLSHIFVAIEKILTPSTLLIHLLENSKKLLMVRVILGQC